MRRSQPGWPRRTPSPADRPRVTAPGALAHVGASHENPRPQRRAHDADAPSAVDRRARGRDPRHVRGATGAGHRCQRGAHARKERDGARQGHESDGRVLDRERAGRGREVDGPPLSPQRPDVTIPDRLRRPDRPPRDRGLRRARERWHDEDANLPAVATPGATNRRGHARRELSRHRLQLRGSRPAAARVPATPVGRVERPRLLPRRVDPE